MAVDSVQDFKISKPIARQVSPNPKPVEVSADRNSHNSYKTCTTGTVLGGGSGVVVSYLKKDPRVNLKFANFAKREIEKIMTSGKAPKIFEELDTIEPSEYIPTYKAVSKNNTRLENYLISHPEDIDVQNSQKRIEGYVKVFESQLNKIKEDFKHLNRGFSIKRGLKFGIIAMLGGLGVSGMVEGALHAKSSKNSSK